MWAASEARRFVERSKSKLGLTVVDLKPVGLAGSGGSTSPVARCGRS